MKAAAEAAGLALRGGFMLSPDERVGPLAGRRAVALLGMVGARPWSAFAASPEASDGTPHPLDRWSRRVVTELARRFDAAPLFPFEGPPYWPFQGWARRAEPVAPSPLGLLIHPRYGLWHSFRGALAGDFDPPPFAPAPNPCDTCDAKPCLTACPVGAFTGHAYVVTACADWLRGQGGDCMSGGCLARRACPAGAAYRQAPEQAAFHMRAFLAARA